MLCLPRKCLGGRCLLGLASGLATRGAVRRRGDPASSFTHNVRLKTIGVCVPRFVPALAATVAVVVVDEIE